MSGEWNKLLRMGEEFIYQNKSTYDGNDGQYSLTYKPCHHAGNWKPIITRKSLTTILRVIIIAMVDLDDSRRNAKVLT